MGRASRLRRRRAAAPVGREELLRAARLLDVRSRREATGLLAGSFTSAFRGGGMVFEESRPYAPGDDVRRIDWNAIARTGQPFVKHYHEERNRTISILLDASASMAFRTTRRSPAQIGAHAASLIAAVAARTGDRVGLVTTHAGGTVVVPAGRGGAHAWRIVDAAARAAERASGDVGLEALLPHVDRAARGDAIVFLVSDMRIASMSDTTPRALPPRISRLGAREDLVSVVVEDPRESEIPDVGRVRMTDPERPGRPLVLDTSDPRVRVRYAEAARVRRRHLERALRRSGSDVVWLRTDRDPLRVLGRFFRERAARVGTGPT